VVETLLDYGDASIVDTRTTVPELGAQQRRYPGDWNSRLWPTHPSPIDLLTPREREILGLLSAGLTGTEIGDLLALRPSTVRSHVQSLLMKLQVHSRLEAVMIAARHGLPQTPTLASGRRQRRAGADRPGERTVSVLLVGRNPSERQAIRDRVNEDPGMSVVAEADGLESLRSAPGMALDVAILCRHADPPEEASAVKEIRQRFPNCRILVVGGSGDPAAVLRALEAGINGYLPAPVSIDGVIQATNDIARGQLLLPRQLHGPLLRHLLQWRLAQHARLELLDRLTKREREVLELLAEGNSNESVARQLMISDDTARTHVRNIMHKLRVHSRVAAAALAMNSGLV
jgi:DNA-binding NarL/FixJ family response regulator